MGKIDYFRQQFVKNIDNEIKKEIISRALKFIKNEVNIFLDEKIKEINKKHDNSIKPQRHSRKSEDPGSTKRSRKYT